MRRRLDFTRVILSDFGRVGSLGLTLPTATVIGASVLIGLLALPFERFAFPNGAGVILSVSPILVLGLALQLSAIALIVGGLRRLVWRSLGFYFVLAAFTYYGLTEIVQRVTRTPSVYRLATTTQAIDEWTVVAGAAMLAFAVGYLVTVRQRSALAVPEPATADPDAFVLLDWRVLSVLSVPLAAIVANGSAYATPSVSGQAVSAGAGLTNQFFLLVVSLTAVSFVRAGSSRRFLPAVIAEVLVLSLAGQRAVVVFGLGMTLFGLRLLDRLPSLREVLISATLVLALVLGINGARAQVGRVAFRSADSATQRLSYLGQGIIDSLTGHTVSAGPDVSPSQPLGERIDGNSFPSWVLHQLNDGYPPVGLTTLKNDVLLAVPSFLNPNKLSTSTQNRVEKVYLQNRYGFEVPGDFLPTSLGSALAFDGVGGLFVIATLFGVGLAFADRFLRHRPSPIRLVVGLGIMYCVLDYEGGFDDYALAVRGIVLAVALLAVGQLGRAAAGKLRPEQTTA